MFGTDIITVRISDCSRVPARSAMSTLVRTAAQDHGYRRWTFTLLSLATKCNELGMPDQAFIFLTAATYYYRMTLVPSRR